MTKSSILSIGSALTLLAVSLLPVVTAAAEKAAPPAKSDQAKSDKKVPDVLNFKMKSLDGKDVNLADYQGKVLLVVNVASQCGYTPQYKGLQALHKQYAKDGLAVLGVPCNQFGRQEPGTSQEIAQFCEKNYGVEFDLLEKVDVNGENACGLYKLLTSKQATADDSGPVKWNFEKFLVGRDGKVVARFRSAVKPESKEMNQAIVEELSKHTSTN